MKILIIFFVRIPTNKLGKYCINPTWHKPIGCVGVVQKRGSQPRGLVSNDVSETPRFSMYKQVDLEEHNWNSFILSRRSQIHIDVLRSSKAGEPRNADSTEASSPPSFSLEFLLNLMLVQLSISGYPIYYAHTVLDLLHAVLNLGFLFYF